VAAGALYQHSRAALIVAVALSQAVALVVLIPLVGTTGPRRRSAE
jgi:hypothetical protein